MLKCKQCKTEVSGTIQLAEHITAKHSISLERLQHQADKEELTFTKFLIKYWLLDDIDSTDVVTWCGGCGQPILDDNFHTIYDDNGECGTDYCEECHFAKPIPVECVEIKPPTSEQDMKKILEFCCTMEHPQFAIEMFSKAVALKLTVKEFKQWIQMQRLIFMNDCYCLSWKCVKKLITALKEDKIDVMELNNYREI